MPEKNPAAPKQDIDEAKEILKEKYPKVWEEYMNDIYLLIDTSNLEKFAEENNLNVYAVNVALVEILNKRSVDPKIV